MAELRLHQQLLPAGRRRQLAAHPDAATDDLRPPQAAAVLPHFSAGGVCDAVPAVISPVVIRDRVADLVHDHSGHHPRQDAEQEGDRLVLQVGPVLPDSRT